MIQRLLKRKQNMLTIKERTISWTVLELRISVQKTIPLRE